MTNRRTELSSWDFDQPVNPGRYHVFIDESEFKQDQLITLGALLVPEDKLAVVNRDVRRLREKLADRMKRHNYIGYAGTDAELKYHRCRLEAARLRAGGLPEIHTKDIWQSARAFYCDRSPASLQRRTDWIYKTLKIIEKHKLTYCVRNFQGSLREFGTSGLLSTGSPVLEMITPDVSLSKIAELEQDIHFAITFELFMLINSLDELGIEIVSVTCDNGKRTELFGKFAGFDRLRSYGFWQNFPNPTFCDSHDSAGLQLSDFATYFTAKVMYYTKEQWDTQEWKIYLRLWPHMRQFETSVGESEIDRPKLPELRYRKVMTAMQFEAALLHCGGFEKSLPEREAAVAHLTKLLFRARDNTMAEAQAASCRGPVWPKLSTLVHKLQLMRVTVFITPIGTV